MKASRANKIVNANLRGCFMRAMIAKRGWSNQEARSYLVEFVSSSTTLSLKDFMEAK